MRAQFNSQQNRQGGSKEVVVRMRSTEEHHKVGARESHNGQEKMAQRKVKNGEESPWQMFSGTNQKPERTRPFGTVLVRHCPQGLLSAFFSLRHFFC